MRMRAPAKQLHVYVQAVETILRAGLLPLPVTELLYCSQAKGSTTVRSLLVM